MSTQTWLLTGGAGYIGSHVADEFLASGKDVVIYDSLYQGLESRIEYLRKKYNKEIPLIIADIRDSETFVQNPRAIQALRNRPHRSTQSSR
jgi:UDP-glucose 4-epimerase